ncbi:hypothetical protein E2C01_058372 [Portunus trituberculatus]|uniref:Uncharacterized protein n=1 Tax=Portunus trituberculatus TaxID=210409 RepID=A0A5B7GW95_PORTR|nr:hypothetical protein [Portunus trituberculatus]
MSRAAAARSMIRELRAAATVQSSREGQKMAQVYVKISVQVRLGGPGPGASFSRDPTMSDHDVDDIAFLTGTPYLTPAP